MRLILCILLFFLVFPASGQTGALKTISAEEAVAMALRNDPSLQTDAGRKKLTRDIKSAWFQWLFQINRSLVIRDQLHVLNDLDRIAAMRYQEGDIELLEKSYFTTELAKIRTNAVVLSNEIDITTNRLRKLLHVPEKIAPADTVLSIYQINKGPGGDLFPGEPPDTLTIENLQLTLDSYFVTLQFYKTAGLDHAWLILKTSQAKFNAEEIDYLEFTRTIGEAYKIRMEYLQVLNDYNQTAIELEHYAY
jgi:outer membrane protein TolC